MNESVIPGWPTGVSTMCPADGLYFAPPPAPSGGVAAVSLCNCHRDRDLSLGFHGRSFPWKIFFQRISLSAILYIDSPRHWVSSFFFASPFLSGTGTPRRRSSRAIEKTRWPPPRQPRCSTSSWAETGTFCPTRSPRSWTGRIPRWAKNRYNNETRIFG